MAAPGPVPIAVIGIGCRLPGGATDPEKLWQLLVDGRNAWSPVPADRWNEAAFYHPNPDNHGTTNHRGGHFIQQDLAAFDASFFGISPIEARAMDPQQRLLLETTYEAFENAGISLRQAQGSNTSVYTAMFTKDYDRNLYKDPIDTPKFHVTGCGEAMMANRISYTFDLKGPSITLDTGCSGSMVALHLACQGLRMGEATMAIASGVNLILTPDHMNGMSNLHMLSDDGRSYSFDERGSGYGRGEGVATILLKRLDVALQARDHVRAVIRHTAVNQDGKTNGITLPSQQAQENLTRSIYQQAGLNPNTVRYVEAHGTGTAAGDIAEVQGIANVFCGSRSRADPLYVGSIKSNIGHTESASGLAAVIKAVLILEKKLIPPNADFRNAKKGLQLDEWNVRVPRELQSWSGDGQVSVNSFGYGGTNAHAILESYSHDDTLLGGKRSIFFDAEAGTHGNGRPLTNGTEAVTTSSDNSTHHATNKNGQNGLAVVKQEPNSVEHKSKSPYLFVVSGASQKSVIGATENLRSWVSTHIDYESYSQKLAYTLSSRRSLLQWRYSFVAGSQQELLDSLDAKAINARKPSPNLRVAFVFTGQGAQWWAMGRELVSAYPVFAESLHKSNAILHELGATWNLEHELLQDESSSRVNESEIAQPATTALQLAMVDLLDTTGIKPQQVIGHSSGEIAAAYAAGIISHATALRVSYCRSFISSYCKRIISRKGAMLAVGLGEDEVLPILATTNRGIVSLACSNSPSSTTVSGDDAGILDVEEILDEKGVFNKRLKVDTAYHSHHMKKVAQEYLVSLGALETNAPRDGVKFISTVTSEDKTSNFGSAYWVENLVSKVRFRDALEKYCRTQLAESRSTGFQTFHSFIEIGPHSALAGPIRQTITQSFNSFKYAYTPTLARGQDARNSFLKAIGGTLENGNSVNLDVANSLNQPGLQVDILHDLPTYPWDHSNTYWYESRLSKNHRFRQHPSHDLLGLRIPSSTRIEPIWRHILSIETLPWLAEHIVDGLVIFPGAGYLCMAIEALRQIAGENQSPQRVSKFILKDVSFSKALVIPTSPGKVEVQLNLRPFQEGRVLWQHFGVSVLSQEELWYQHCQGMIRAEVMEDLSDLDQDLEATRKELSGAQAQECQRKLSSESIYSTLRSNGNIYGPLFATIEELSIKNLRARGQISIPDVESAMPSNHMEPHIIHPTTLDTILHTSLPLYTQIKGPGAVIPVFLGDLIVSSSIANTPGTRLAVTASLESTGSRSAETTLSAFQVDSGGKWARVLTASHVEMRGLGETWTKSDASVTKTAILQMKWAADVDSLSPHPGGSPVFLTMDEYVQHLCFKQSHMAVLQIGGGGDVNVSALRALHDNDLSSIKSIDFADASIETFKKLENSLQPWNMAIQFKNLDVLQNVAEHGFAMSSYDLILANVSPQIESHLGYALANIRKLLRTGGKLILINERSSPFSNDEMHKILLRSLFSGIDIIINDTRNTPQNGRIVVSKAVEPDTGAATNPILIIAEEEMETFAATLRSELEIQGLQVASASLMSTFSNDATYVVVDNGRRPLLTSLTSERFSALTKLLRGRSKVLWISVYDDISFALNPTKGLITGLARSARAENDYLKLITFDIQDPLGDCLPELLVATKSILQSSFGSSTQSEDIEYAFRGGQLLVPRAIPDTSSNMWMNNAAGKPGIEAAIYGDHRRPLTLKLARTGPSGSLNFEDDLSMLAPLGHSQVEVEVKWHAMNSKDAKAFRDISEPPSQILRTFAGIVTAVGSKVSTKFKIGDRICGWSIDGAPYPSHLRIDTHQVSLLPELLSSAAGCAIAAPLMTAYYSLVELADLQKGQTVLIHGVAGDVCQAALIVAQHTRAEVLVTYSSIAERDGLKKRFRLSDTQIIPDELIYLKTRILQRTGGSGVDVVMNSIEFASEMWDCVASLGVYIQIRDSTTYVYDRARIALPRKSATFVSFDLPTLITRRPHKVTSLLGKAMSIFQGSTVLPNPRFKIMSIGDIQDSFKLLQGQKDVGNIVLQVEENIRVNTWAPHPAATGPQNFLLNPDVSYVIVGGSGDLGHTICHVIATRGAKHIVLLARRILEEKRIRELQNEVQQLSAGCILYSIPCDISDEGAVEKTVSGFESIGIPPVKGVVHSAGVLQDRILELMTADDFRRPLDSKLWGTQNLSHVFGDSSLDFFIMFSSLSGIVGSQGQANYAAGNTYQDALAHSKAGSKTCYISLDLGIIDGTAVFNQGDGQKRLKNLLRHGLTPVKSEQLLSFFDYVISPQAQTDNCTQLMIGIDKNSIQEADNLTATTRSAIFTHVHQGKARTESEPVTKSPKKAITHAEHLEDILRIISVAIAQQIASLTDLDSEAIDMDAPISSFGIDSLAAIELKNWAFEEFEASINASEILDEANIMALAGKVASRSLAQNAASEVDTAVGSEVSALETPAQPTIFLPRLPLPDLEGTLDLYIDSARLFLSDDQLKHTSEAIRDFKSGLGSELQKRLEVRDKDPQIDSWQHDLQVKAVYLDRRDPTYPYGIFYGGHILSDVPHSQSERAAVISIAAYKFMMRLEAGELEQDYLNEEPTCMATLQWLFNANRRPCLRTDDMCKFPGNHYLVALRRGHIFKISLTPTTAYTHLKAAFDAIVSNSEGRLEPVAILSADERNSWARRREALMSADPANETLVNTIEAAAFVICLDDGSPSTPTERCNQFLLGDPANRWSDKSLQFVVCENGVSAYICEHSMLDATSAKQINKYITRAILDHKPSSPPKDTLNGTPNTTNGAVDGNGRVVEYNFTVTAGTKGHISRVQNHFRVTHASIEFTHFHIPTISKSFFRKNKVPSKAGCQVIIQLASLLYFGRQYPAWEVLSMAPFHKGRLDWMQVVSPSVFAFCEAVSSSLLPTDQQRALFLRAVHAHASIMTRISRGRGFLAHLEALNAVLQPNETIPDLFTDTTWELMRVTSARKIKTDASENMLIQEGGYLMPNPDSIFVHYEVDNKGCKFFIQSTEGRTERFYIMLERAAKIIEDIFYE